MPRRKPQPTRAPVSARVVLRHGSGRRTGLRQILGTVDQALQELGVESLPSQIEGVDFVGHRGSCRLVGVFKRYVLYTEVTP
jgi:hypothetical protein